MTTPARSAQVPTARARSAAVIEQLGLVPFALSIALVFDTAAASLASLLVRDAIRGPAVTVGSLQGTALVLVVVTLPVLAGSMAFAARGSGLALIGWFGAVGSIAYQSVLFVFATPFNAFFFLYVGMLSLSTWTLVALLSHVPVDRLAERFGPRIPVRALAAYLLVNVGLFLLLWLQATVPAVLSTEPPAFLEGTGMTTGPVQVMDLAFTLPLMTLAAIWLWQRRPWGYLLTGGLLVMLTIETASIGTDQWFGHAADPASPVASAALVPVFAVLTVIGLVALGVYLRASGGTARSEGRVRS